VKFNNRVKAKTGPALWKIAVFLIVALVLNMATIYQVQAQGINDYFQLSYSIIGPSQTTVTGSQIFTVRVTGSAITRQTLPIAPSSARITGEIVAQNTSTGYEAKLNPSYVVTISPFPSTQGATYSIDQTVNLQFPSGSPSGNYTIVGRLVEALVFVSILSMPVTSMLPQTQSIGAVSYSASVPVAPGGSSGGGGSGGGGGGVAPIVIPTPTASPAPTVTPAPTPVATPLPTVTPAPTSPPTQTELRVAIDTLPVSGAASQLAVASASDAARVIQDTPPQKAAPLLAELSTLRATEIINGVTTAKAGDLLGMMAVDKAARVMEQLDAAKFEQVLQLIPQKALRERLAEVSPSKGNNINPQTLFRLLPQAPTEQLVKEVPPVVAPGLSNPVATLVTATQTNFAVPQIRAGEWATLATTPKSTTNMVAKFTESFSNFTVSFEELATKPVEIKSEPPGQKVNSYIRIELPQNTEGKMDAGYIGFKVDKSWIQANNINKWSVVVRRYDTNQNVWVPLPTRRVAEDAASVEYTSTTPGFSTFAIVGSTEVPDREFQVTNLSVSPAQGVEGQPVKIDAEIENLTGSDRIFAVPLWVNGTVESSRMITIAAGAKSTLSFTLYKAAGSYEVRVDRQIKNIQVVTPAPVVAAIPTATPIAPPAPTATMNPTPANTPVQTPAVTPTVILTPTTTPLPSPTPVNVITPVPTPVSGVPQPINFPVMAIVGIIAVPMMIGGAYDFYLFVS